MLKEKINSVIVPSIIMGLYMKDEPKSRLDNAARHLVPPHVGQGTPVIA